MGFNGLVFLRAFLNPLGNGQAGASAKAAHSDLLEYGALDVEAVLKQLGASRDGLLRQEAGERLEQYGENVVAHEQHKSPVRRLLELFFAPLSLLLFSLAIVAELTGGCEGLCEIGA